MSSGKNRKRCSLGGIVLFSSTFWMFFSIIGGIMVLIGPVQQGIAKEREIEKRLKEEQTKNRIKKASYVIELLRPELENILNDIHKTINVLDANDPNNQTIFRFNNSAWRTVSPLLVSLEISPKAFSEVISIYAVIENANQLYDLIIECGLRGNTEKASDNKNVIYFMSRYKDNLIQIKKWMEINKIGMPDALSAFKSE
jgi:hypothetical protein